jgi:hypothetical protein
LKINAKKNLPPLTRKFGNLRGLFLKKEKEIRLILFLKNKCQRKPSPLTRKSRKSRKSRKPTRTIPKKKKKETKLVSFLKSKCQRKPSSTYQKVQKVRKNWS